MDSATKPPEDQHARKPGTKRLSRCLVALHKLKVIPWFSKKNPFRDVYATEQDDRLEEHVTLPRKGQ